MTKKGVKLYLSMNKEQIHMNFKKLSIIFILFIIVCIISSITLAAPVFLTVHCNDWQKINYKTSQSGGPGVKINRVVIDRFEGEYAVVELPNRVMVDVPKIVLPDEAVEGDIIEIRIGRDKVQEAQIKDLMDEVWE
jgi:hypothetical protein